VKWGFYIKKIFISGVITVFGILLITAPEICKSAVLNSIILCGKTLIPALFPFSFCVIFITKAGFLQKFNFATPFTRSIFGISGEIFAVMLLSMVGGYPIGAKLINQMVSDGRLTPKAGRKMLNFCVNAGPAFIVSAVGNGILKSPQIGYILLASHLSASLVICAFLRFTKEKIILNKTVRTRTPSVSNNFVDSANQSAEITFNICSFVILFSVITAYADRISFLKPLFYSFEITNALTKTRNIYIISFLLGFAGLCIWFQILSVGKEIKINILNFAIFRIIHGVISVLVTMLLLNIFEITLPTFSNNKHFSGSLSVSGKALSVALLVMAVIFIISLNGKHKNTKILEEFT